MGGQPDVLPEVVIEQEGTSSAEEQEAKRNESDTADEEFGNEDVPCMQFAGTGGFEDVF